jgi:hypothetical protein
VGHPIKPESGWKRSVYGSWLNKKSSFCMSNTNFSTRQMLKVLPLKQFRAPILTVISEHSPDEFDYLRVCSSRPNPKLVV